MLSPERTPLALFGRQASAAVSALLAQAGIAFRGAVCAEVSTGRANPARARAARQSARTASSACLRSRGRACRVSRQMSSASSRWTSTCRVDGVDHVHAAGDAADFPVKQGGLACQQADTVAEHIAARVVAGHSSPSPSAPSCAASC